MNDNTPTHYIRIYESSDSKAKEVQQYLHLLLKDEEATDISLVDNELFESKYKFTHVFCASNEAFCDEKLHTSWTEARNLNQRIIFVQQEKIQLETIKNWVNIEKFPKRLNHIISNHISEYNQGSFPIIEFKRNSDFAKQFLATIRLSSDAEYILLNQLYKQWQSTTPDQNLLGTTDLLAIERWLNANEHNEKALKKDIRQFIVASRKTKKRLRLRRYQFIAVIIFFVLNIIAVLQLNATRQVRSIEFANNAQRYYRLGQYAEALESAQKSIDIYYPPALVTQRILIESLFTPRLIDRIILTDHDAECDKDREPLDRITMTSLVGDADKDLLISGYKDGSIVIRNLVECFRTSRLKINESNSVRVSALQLLDDTRYVAVGYADGRIIIWDYVNLDMITMLVSDVTSGSPVTNIEISIQDSELLAGYDNGSVVRWNWQEQEQLYIYEGHSLSIRDIAIVPEHGIFVSVGDDKVVKIWEIESGELLYELEGHNDWVTAVAIKPKFDDSFNIVSGAQNGEIILWNLEEGVPEWRVSNHVATIRSIIILDNNQIIAASDDHTITINDILTGNSNYTLGQQQTGHRGSINSLFINDEQNVLFSVSYSDQETIKWVINTGNLADIELLSDEIPTGNVLAVNIASFSSYQHRALTSYSGGRSAPKVWNVASSDENFYVNTLSVPDELKIHMIALAPAGKVFVSGGRDGSLYLWNIDPQNGPIERLGQFTDNSYELTGPINALAISDDSSHIAATSNFDIFVWNVKDRSFITRLGDHSKRIVSLTLSADGKLLASADEDGRIIVWEWQDGSYRKLKEDRTSVTDSYVYDLLFLADGNELLWTEQDLVYRWAFRTTSKKIVLKGNDIIRDLAVNQASNQLLSASQSGTLDLWDLNSNEIIHQYHLGSAITSIDISPEGCYAIAGGIQGQLFVLNIPNIDILLEWVQLSVTYQTSSANLSLLEYCLSRF